MNIVSLPIDVIYGKNCCPEGAFQFEPMATPWVGKIKSEPSPEGAIESPGQGFEAFGWVALSGLLGSLRFYPRALPWALRVMPLRGVLGSGSVWDWLVMPIRDESEFVPFSLGRRVGDEGVGWYRVVT
jgi:hypothetical protein